MMLRRRAGAVVAMLVVLLFAGAMLFAHSRAKEGPADRPSLLLLTSLPLLFGEGFTLDQTGSAALTRLQSRYGVRTIALADRASLAGHQLLLLAHPRAQTAEALVDLDAWVRAGGRVLLLADPALDWPSERPLGDRLRPPPGFSDTGLLAHWGVTLSPPSQRGLVVETVGGRKVGFSSPGRLTAARCVMDGGSTIARCGIGRGRVTIIADADLLNPDESGAEAAQNLDMVMAELAVLAR